MHSAFDFVASDTRQEELYQVAIPLSKAYTWGMGTQPTTMRLTKADKQAIEAIKTLYGYFRCNSDTGSTDANHPRLGPS
jgi:hypothetical protein